MKWVGRFMANRAEDYLRKATGMPPRPGSREAKRQEKARAADSGEPRRRSQRDSRNRRGQYYRTDSGPIIPKEYAEDVEFTETIDYSETTIAGEDTRRSATSYHESQVSDVEWEEVKTSKGKKDKPWARHSS